MTGYKKYYYEFGDVFEYLVGIVCRFVSKRVALPLASYLNDELWILLAGPPHTFI